ncbi:DEAD DEAH box helicase domain-containing protein [Babesia ovis]|uniref:DEAD DEAH box helicase domain-containing protein n=1 Tax=Babesia ovis TaxID=5869 RepID=A0A9W5TB30_BABOV|nr:DEAD DEAH box helicase domain-containing protein [Babesia ovis]
MARLYDNISEFWTSDEEDREDPGGGRQQLDTSRQNGDTVKDPVHPLDFSQAFRNPLESIGWVPVINSSDQKYSPFEVLDREDSDHSFDIDVDLLERQLFGESMGDYEEEFELNVADVSQEFDTACRIEADVQEPGYDQASTVQEHNINKKEVIVNIRPLEVEENKANELVIPKPEEGKNYIRTKWSVVDDSSTPELSDLIIEYPFELDEFQKRAIYHLHNMKHVFVAAHTSSGKTVVAEYAVALALSRGKKAVYTSPIKALSNQKFREFTNRYGNETVGIITGDVSCNPNAPCLIVTTEILRNLLYRGDPIIGQLGVVIFDEVHYINDFHRGVVWEEVFIMLPKSIQLVMLSATVPNYAEFADWIGAIMEREVITIVTSKRPVPLVHFLYIYGRIFLLLDNKGGFNKDAYHKMYKFSTMSKGSAMKRTSFKGQVQKLQRLIRHLETTQKLPVVLFCFNRAKCEAYAKEMPNLNLSYTQVQRSKIHLFIKESLATISESDRNLMQVKSIIKLLYRGIGVHHSGLLPLMKEIVEILFSRGLIKVLFATETFAMGVNMPARSVIFTSIHKHDGQKTRHLTASEYTQMAGRAGRRGLDSFGSVYIFCPDEPPDLQDLTTMMFEKSTRLESKFRITYNMLLQVHSREHMNITEMMLKSFKENDKMKNIPIFKRDGIRKRQELSMLPKIDCIYGDASIEDYHRLDACSRKIAHSLHESLWNHRENSQVFKAGRVLMIHSIGLCNTSCYGCIISSSKGKPLDLKVLILVPELYDQSTGGNIHTTISSYNHEEIQFTICDKVDIANVSFIYNNVLDVKPAQGKMGATQDLGIAMLSSVASELHKLVSTQKIDLLVFNKQLKQTSLQFYGVVLKQRDIYHEMSRNQCTRCHLRDKHYTVQEKIESCRAELKRISEHLKEESLYAYDDMVAKVEVLKQLDFLDQNGKPTVKGRIATYLTTGDEITLTETITQNILNGLEPEECAAILSAFVHNDRAPEKEVPAPTLAIQKARDMVLDLHSKVDVVQRALNVNVPREDHAALCNFSLSYVIYQWAIGTPFSEIMQYTDLQEGHIVRAITRLDELCRKIGQVAHINGDEALQAKIEKVSNSIKRGIVFMPSLYLT